MPALPKPAAASAASWATPVSTAPSRHPQDAPPAPGDRNRKRRCGSGEDRQQRRDPLYEEPRDDVLHGLAPAKPGRRRTTCRMRGAIASSRSAIRARVTTLRETHELNEIRVRWPPVVHGSGHRNLLPRSAEYRQRWWQRHPIPKHTSTRVTSSPGPSRPLSPRRLRCRNSLPIPSGKGSSSARGIRPLRATLLTWMLRQPGIPVSLSRPLSCRSPQRRTSASSLRLFFERTARPRRSSWLPTCNLVKGNARIGGGQIVRALAEVAPRVVSEPVPDVASSQGVNGRSGS
jgi:hypothetical protein